MKIAILNASNPKMVHLEHDCYVDYRDGRQRCFSEEGGQEIKPARSWHGWAYALETEFFVYQKPKWPGIFQYDGVIILVNRNIGDLIPLVKQLKSQKKKVGISFHEGIQDLITSSGISDENVFERWKDLKTLVDYSDFYINIFGQMHPFFEGWFGYAKVKFCDHCAPLDWEGAPKLHWDEKPFDVLIGTRTFNQRLSRNTFISLAALNGFAKQTGKNVHYLSEDGNVAAFLRDVGLNYITVHQGPLKWNDWIKFLSQFKTLVHFDKSMNLAQVALDCAMVRTIPVGSTCWNAIQIGTDDHGDLRMTLELLNNVFEHPHSRIYAMKEFREKTHPDKIKQDLIRIFNE